MERLTLPIVCDIVNGQDIREAKVLNASHKGIKYMDDISPCVELEKLRISHNFISSIDGFKHCCSLTWLDVSHNQLESLLGIQSLVNLNVLNAGHNKLRVVGSLTNLKALKALILNNNYISSINGLSALTKLNTLVLSHNLLEAISLDKLSLLTKLSLSYNQLRAPPDTKDCHKLKELRLNNNKIFANLPNTLINNQCLEILDIGNNLLSSWSSCESVLRQLTALRNLNLNGNKFAIGQFYKEVLCDLPSLGVLNGKKKDSYDKTEHRVVKDSSSKEWGGDATADTLTDNGTLHIKRSSGNEGDVKQKEGKHNLPAKKPRHMDQDLSDDNNDRFSISAMSGFIPLKLSSIKRKHKAKSVSGVVSVSKRKTRKKKETDINALGTGLNFGTGITPQWF